MKIKGKTVVDVELSKEDQDDICLATLTELCNFDKDDRYHVDDEGYLIRSEELSAGAHSYWSKTKMRKATPLEKACILVKTEMAQRMRG